jgi:hypothetical protein
MGIRHRAAALVVFGIGASTPPLIEPTLTILPALPSST